MASTHRYSRMHLSPEEAMRNLDATDLGETSNIAEGIALIAVIDERRDYLAAGYSSMRNYCMGRRRWSEDKALRRIQVARAALRFPEVFEYLADGRLGVTTASVLTPHLEPETAAELLEAAAFRTQHEIVQMLAQRSRPPVATPVADAGELLAAATSGEHAVPHAISHLTHCECVSGDVNAAAPAQAPAKKPRRGRVTPAATGEYEVRLTITEAEHAELVRAQALLGHAVPSGDPALVYARAMKHYLAHLEKERLGVKPGAAVAAAGARRIPKALRRFVWERDGARCAFVSAEGHRCEETRRLEIDHVTPLALGGTSTAENLRLLCSAHNQHEAERVLDKEHVHRRREIARRERARDRAAAQASAERQRARDAVSAEGAAARAKAREAAKQARHDDVYAALRGLGSCAADARRGAEIADAMPDDATTVECLKAALTELARPLLKRCERLARCTT
jgi:hypothetical protein